MGKCLICATIFLISVCVTPVWGIASRDYIYIVGSSTVYPFMTVVAERFGKSTEFKTPKIESTGSGGGLKLFAAGIGVKHPDITNSSRRIKKAEFEAAVANGVKNILEVKIGYDGIVVANTNAGPVMKLTLKDLFLALAQKVPEKGNRGEFIANPYKTWKEVNPSLPDMKIEILGPPPTSGTRDAFIELAMEGGAKQFDSIQALKEKNKNLYKILSNTIREDGAYIEVGENDNLIIQKLIANPNVLGIFGFSFLNQNTDKIRGSAIEGVFPTFEAILDGSYTLSRPLFFYVKKAHINNIPGLSEFLAEFTNENAWGNEGYLTDIGLIPLSQKERLKVKNDIEKFNVLTLSDF